MDARRELVKLYSNKSKHSNYQILPRILEPILGQEQIDVRTRYERERLDYILNRIVTEDKSVLDIGGNTGFFSFELLDAGAESVHLYEGNKDHCEFVKLAIEALNVDKFAVTNDYYPFDDSANSRYDVVLLLNVLHHVGDDYGDKSLSIEKAKELIITQLNFMSNVASTLVFQLGFNWMGDPLKPLFQNGTKSDLIEFIRTGTEDYWDITAIGVAEGGKQDAHYSDLSDGNISRDDELGEFLNRPIFILESKNGKQ